MQLRLRDLGRLLREPLAFVAYITVNFSSGVCGEVKFPVMSADARTLPTNRDPAACGVSPALRGATKQRARTRDSNCRLTFVRPFSTARLRPGR